uniref:Ultraviolet-B receptor UVR8-like n=1 Tax=Dermatophagoides pteronyssinus TaxID=6956 RepID=A0A6P6YCI8_DERPT|nr:ultraviolet-B receptor UVR8-like [Dermatophagoides pteronyssinus]
MIACGWDHLLLLRQDGTVFALGGDGKGQLTDNSEPSYDIPENTDLKNVEIIACGRDHCLALTNVKELYSWGHNTDGQLGQGDEVYRKKPTPVSDNAIDSPIKDIVAGYGHSLFLLENGQIFGCGYGQRSMYDNEHDANVPTKIIIENVQKVACKNNHTFSFFLDQSSHYYVWGDWADENEDEEKKDEELLQPKKLDGQLKSFVAASIMHYKSLITYGLTSIIHVLE